MGFLSSHDMKTQNPVCKWVGILIIDLDFWKCGEKHLTHFNKTEFIASKPLYGY